ncbi:hypothetical protein AB0392_47720 [Nonomuraea angiospora]|uniref:hypothetical protein n=1 Tax=Nonomuraea angiospora TaxID=46172 RepID=UPI00344C63D9
MRPAARLRRFAGSRSKGSRHVTGAVAYGDPFARAPVLEGDRRGLRSGPQDSFKIGLLSGRDALPLGEAAGLIDGDYLHVGGDEAPEWSGLAPDVLAPLVETFRKARGAVRREATRGHRVPDGHAYLDRPVMVRGRLDPLGQSYC